MSDAPPPAPEPARHDAATQTGRHHDHSACIARAHAALDALEASGRARPTPARRQVLEILLESHRALGAYDILRRLDAEGQPAQPPVAYRALAFLERHGLVHRIERLNAYVACPAPSEDGTLHDAAFLVCRDCRLVVEAAGGRAARALTEAARDTGFMVETTVIEAIGLCRDCAGVVEGGT